MAKEPVLVEGAFRVPTTMGINYYEAGRRVTIDKVAAEECGAWKHFEPDREVSRKEAEERAEDEKSSKEKK